MESFRVHGTVTPEDFVRAQRTHARPRPWLLRAGWILLALYVAITVLAVVQYVRTGGGLAAVALFLLLALYLPYFFFVAQPRTWRRHFVQQKALQSPCEIEFSTQGLQTASEFGNASLPWEMFHKWRDGRHTFLLYHSEALFNMVPKRWMSAEQAAVLEQLLDSRVRRAA